MSRLNYDPFQAIADNNRRQILMMLSEKSLSINLLADQFDISRPAVSKHIKVLEETGFISIRQEGRERLCELNSAGFDAVREWLTYYDQFWKRKLQNLEALLEQRKKGKKGR
ncbi:DNA-binding transcriptional regulator, ArsR family [Chitinophaga terrae (ex Kim and Jung 2007)]|uniref:DNA-binding transcriptional regulator, ArsR family n=1 Tax=Chitinophaga terrae (ex Kim and Jung 2007) TaxID=408074 RepID=A0A1H4GLB3_9BACT|nr:metalloregulator ArsR/SmtB family transcription factor [Chitinophaga terrae (ex Kim and Jung 2007)]MDQ0110381.1 DNA-binding transcriptional ArsR family regulator [Chitinophaga terrae (ex Kim and Jung 2007)]GEP93541.1 transcriptional regulator [Chitinophaga terrae (ex Kim and Jung 2007)]SEB10121.1 DNA-binding transcriptional regulator, ArsR family [Chitinophaga terrae (ex Kim and Jung 2007)]